MSEAQSFPAGEAIKAIKDLAVRAAGVTVDYVSHPFVNTGVPEQIPVAIVHGEQPKIIGVSELFESYRERPRRKDGVAKVLTLQSLIDLTQRHQTEHSAIFADTSWQQPSITVVIDYHEIDRVVGALVAPVEAEPGSAGAAPVDDPIIVSGPAAFGKHRIHYAFPLSEEWQAWVTMDGEKMDQGDFAAFIEDHIAELWAPTDAERIWIERDFQTTVATPAQLIQLSRGLQVHVASKVKDLRTLQTGEASIAWEESHLDADGKPLKVPGMFMLNIAPFFMGEPIAIPVRLRYRPAGGKIIWFYQIYRPDQHVTARVRSDLRKVADDTALPAYEGRPEMGA